MKRPLRALALAAVLAAVGLLGPPVSGAPFAGPLPQVYVYIGPVAPVDVDTDGDLNITTQGEVNVTLFSFVATRINLTVLVQDTYWPASIEPQSMTLTGSGSIPFTVNVTVPARAPAGSDSYILVVANVSSSQYPVGRDFSNTTAIPVKQYFGVQLTASTPSSPEPFEAQAGKETSFAFKIQNTGNGVDSFEIRLLNLADLQASGISVDIPSPVTNVARGVTAIKGGKVTLPASVVLGDHAMQIEASSAGALAKSLTATGVTTKTIRAVPPSTDGGGNDNGSQNDTVPKPAPFVPGASAPLAIAALGAAFTAAVWRRVRPPSQGAACRESPAPSRGQGP